MGRVRSAGALTGLWPLLFICMLMGSACTSVNPYFDPSKVHHTPQGFRNSDGSAGGKGLGALVRWYVERTLDGVPKPPSTHVNGYAFPLSRPDLAFLHANRREPSLTWIGHATLLVQIGGLNVLTDPHFSDRAFAVQWMGPKRRVPLTVKLDELPPIDVVVISHAHYDHLDETTVEALVKQPGGAPLFAVPLGLERWLEARGARRVLAFDWWQTVHVAGIELHFVPARHWSARTPFDRNTSLWGGWVLRTKDFSFYFAGDTGYSRDFVEIGERFGGFDLAAIPVGAYLPRWFMKDQHVDPDEAVRIHLDVRARQSVGIHWGSFELTDEPLDAPIGELAQARSRHGIAASAFVLYQHGETRRYGPSPPRLMPGQPPPPVQSDEGAPDARLPFSADAPLSVRPGTTP